MMNSATLAPRKLPRGIALLEAVIAIGVLLAGVVGSLVLINSTIRLGRANQDRVVAQNLAREGMEIAYSLRNDAALAKVENQSLTWDQYLFGSTPKSDNVAAYKARYDLGLYIDNIDNGKCFQRCDGTETVDCKNDSSDPTPDNSTTKITHSECDTQALYGYLDRSYGQAPPKCDTTIADNITDFDGTLGSLDRPCDYNSDGVLDISDVMQMITDIYLNSYHITSGYPDVSLLGTSPTRRLDFFQPTLGDTIDLKTEVWDKTQARVYEESDHTFSQVTTSGTPSKFYRVVSIQAICHGTYSGAESDLVIPQNYLLNCRDYANAQNISNGNTNWDINSMKKIGGLVTSEVRWPTPVESSPHVIYQEYLYDWLNP